MKYTSRLTQEKNQRKSDNNVESNLRRSRFTKELLKLQEVTYQHYFSTSEPAIAVKERLSSEVIGWDTEYLPPDSEGSPQKPVTTALAYHLSKKPKFFESLIPVAKKGVTEIYEGGVLGMPYLLYAYLSPMKVFSKASGVSGWIVGFVFDSRGVQAGEDYQWFFNALFVNIRKHTGIYPASFTDKPNPKLCTTYSEAELGCILPSYSTEQNYRIKINEASEFFDLDSKILTLQGSTIISDYPIYSEDVIAYKLDLIDTRHQGGRSVAAIGNTLGCEKVKGFDFEEHDAEYFLEKNTLDFCYYNYVDALISLGSELLLHKALLNVINTLVDRGLIDKVWFENKNSQLTTWEYAERKRTSSGIGETIAFSYLKRNKLDKQFTKNAKLIDEKLNFNDKKVHGGLNQRTTGTITPEFFDNLNTWDFSSHYPHCMIALGKFPIYEPVGFGYVKNTAKNLYSQLGYLDWYVLRASFTYPENTPLLNRLLLQNYDGTSINPEQVEKLLLTPPLLAVIAQITPDINITVEHGWQWDSGFLQDTLKEGEKVEDYYIDFSPLMIELLKLREKYKRENNDLMQTAVKLVMNSVYGKHAQDKLVFDPESLDLTITMGGEISSIANKKRCKSLVTHSVYANAITSLGRAITWWVAYKNDAVLTVTDSIAVTHDNNVELKDYLIGDRYIDTYLNHGSIKLETPTPTMGLVTGVRGRFLADYDAKLAEAIKSGDWEAMEAALLQHVEDKKREGKAPQKIAKDGFKYDGESWTQWLKCSLDHLKRYAGYPVEHEQTHLTKRNEVRQGKALTVNYQGAKTSVKDCTEPRSGRYRTYDDYLAVKRFYDKVKRDNKKHKKQGKYQGFTAGQIHRFNKEWFESEMKKSKSRRRAFDTVPVEIKRLIALFCHLKLISQKTFADLLGIKPQAIAYWVAKLEKGLTTDYWGEQILDEYQKIKKTYHNCAEGVLQFSQKVDLGDEVTSKRANNSIGKALSTLEQYFGVKFGRKSKRARKLTLVA